MAWRESTTVHISITNPHNGRDFGICDADGSFSCPSIFDTVGGTVILRGNNQALFWPDGDKGREVRIGIGGRSISEQKVNLDQIITNRETQLRETNHAEFLKRQGAEFASHMALSRRIDEIERNQEELRNFCIDLERRQRQFEEATTRAIQRLFERVTRAEFMAMTALQLAEATLRYVSSELESDRKTQVKFQRVLSAETNLGNGLKASVGETIISEVSGGNLDAASIGQQIAKMVIDTPRTVSAWVSSNTTK